MLSIIRTNVGRNLPKLFWPVIGQRATFMASNDPRRFVPMGKPDDYQADYSSGNKAMKRGFWITLGLYILYIAYRDEGLFDPRLPDPTTDQNKTKV